MTKNGPLHANDLEVDGEYGKSILELKGDPMVVVSGLNVVIVRNLKHPKRIHLNNPGPTISEAAAEAYIVI